MGNIGYSMEELIPVVAELANKYTGYDSTSITYEKAQQLIEAVIFCIREYEGNIIEGGKSVPAGMEGKILPAKEAYQLGYQMVIEKTKAARERYNTLMLSFRHYGNRAYRDTILEEMPEFFRHYDARFEPQNFWMALEYPLMVSLGESEGIDRIDRYLYCVQLEQKFLAGLPEGYPEQAFRAYHEDYGELVVNLPEIILEDMQKRSRISGKNTDLQGLVNEIVGRAYGKDEGLRAYLLRKCQADM